jgi:formylglycine-generating enzyme required for sulfatase activity
MKYSTACAATILFGSLLPAVLGCSDETEPVGVTPALGTIVIDATPDTIEARWTMAGPEDYSQDGYGDLTIVGLVPGDYVLTWEQVNGYGTPPPETRSLAANNTVEFSGVYFEAGTIVIDQIPSELPGAGWVLVGPHSATGFGDSTMTFLPTGDYAVVWTDLWGYMTPQSSIQSLHASGTTTFRGIYTHDPSAAGEFVRIPSGMFEMGSPEDELGRSSDESLHTVTLTTPFLMSTTEVTNRQFVAMAQWAYDNGFCTATSSEIRDALDGSTDVLIQLDDGYCEVSFIDGAFTVNEGKEDYPVLKVLWRGAVAYCDWLSLRTGLQRAYDHSTWLCNEHDPYGAEGYRLPTEAEWEYACRAGSSTAFAVGEISSMTCADSVLDGIGWYCGNSGGHAHPVGQLTPNAWGLYDMHGNLWECCNDFYAAYSGDVTDPTGPSSGSTRVFRSGPANYVAPYCRSAKRNYALGEWNVQFGFRPVRSSD